MTPTEELRTWMRLKRRSLGMSQTELGSLIGLDQTLITKIECGKQGISWDRGWAIIEALDKPPAELAPPIPRTKP